MSELRIHRTAPSAKVVLLKGQRNKLKNEIKAGMYVEGGTRTLCYDTMMERSGIEIKQIKNTTFASIP